MFQKSRYQKYLYKIYWYEKYDYDLTKLRDGITGVLGNNIKVNRTTALSGDNRYSILLYEETTEKQFNDFCDILYKNVDATSKLPYIFMIENGNKNQYKTDGRFAGIDTYLYKRKPPFNPSYKKECNKKIAFIDDSD